MASSRKQLAFPDIRFTDEKMNRLVQHMRGLTQEVQRLQAMLDGGTPGQVLTKQTEFDFDAEWQDP